MSRADDLGRYLAHSGEMVGKLRVPAIDAVVEVLVRTLESERFIYVMGGGA